MKLECFIFCEDDNAAGRREGTGEIALLTCERNDARTQEIFYTFDKTSKIYDLGGVKEFYILIVRVIPCDS